MHFAVLALIPLLLAFLSPATMSGKVPDDLEGCAGDYGYTAAGASQDGNSGDIYCQRFTISCEATVSSIPVYTKSTNNASREREMALYDDSVGEPNNLIGSYGAFNDGTTANHWMVDNTVGALLSAGDYWVCTMQEFNPSDIFYDSGAGQVRHHAGTFGTWPDPWTTTTSYSDRRYSIYATF